MYILEQHPLILFSCSGQFIYVSESLTESGNQPTAGRRFCLRQGSTSRVTSDLKPGRGEEEEEKDKEEEEEYKQLTAPSNNLCFVSAARLPRAAALLVDDAC